MVTQLPVGSAPPPPAPEADVAAASEPVAPSRVGPPRPKLVVVALTVVMVLSVAVVFVGVFALGLSSLQEHRSQRLLYAEFRGLLDPQSETPPSIGGAIPLGTPVALVNAPQAGLHDAMVVEGTTSNLLLEGPGHLRNTPLPGQRGDAVLLGRSTTAGGAFSRLHLLAPGDTITVRTGQGLFRFTVVDLRTAGEHAPLIPGGGGLLTLVTSTGQAWLGPLTPDRLLYVDAKLQGKAVAAPKGRPTTVTVAERQGASDSAAWPWLVLWLALLAALVALCWWLWQRLGILRTWIIGVPLLFGVLWGLSTEIVRLLPNIY